MIDIPKLREQIAGKTLNGVWRVWFSTLDGVERDDGPLELELDSQRYCFDSASNGEDMAIRRGPWTDPMAPPVTQSTQEFLATSGRWQKFDVSNEAAYEALVGTMVESVVEVRNHFGRVSGVTIATKAALLTCRVDCDTVIVDIEIAPAIVGT